MKSEAEINAALQELGTQRQILGDRAAVLAAENIALKIRISELLKQVADLSKAQSAQ